MQINRVQNYNTSFGIKISPNFIKAADEYYIKHNNSQAQLDKFHRKAKKMEEDFGFNEYTIEFKNCKINSKRVRALFAVKNDGSNPVLLAYKNSFTKLLNRFNQINEYELNNKLL